MCGKYESINYIVYKIIIMIVTQDLVYNSILSLRLRRMVSQVRMVDVL